MVEHGLFEDLFHVLWSDFNRGLPRGAQVLATIDGEINLIIAKLFGLVL